MNAASRINTTTLSAASPCILPLPQCSAFPRRTERTTMPTAKANGNREIAKAIEQSQPGVEVTRDVEFGELWQFFKDTGFLYPAKIATLEPVLPEIERTVTALLAANGNLMHTIVMRENGMLQGHVCALTTHSRTWSSQHLAVRPLSSRRVNASGRLNSALASYVDLMPDAEWQRMCFRPSNPFPSRVFGGFARAIADPHSSDLRQFHYLVSPTAPAPALPVTVRQPHDSELSSIDAWYLSRGRSVEWKANDLSGPDKCLQEIGRRYAAIGLTRRREILVAERRGRIAGFALLDISSLGMNFSELTNAFTVHMIDDDPESCLALVRKARERYRELGRSHCVALDEGDSLSVFEAAGFTETKVYACWTFHRSHLSPMAEYFDRLLTVRRAGAARCI
jgi:hypothetical protein